MDLEPGESQHMRKTHLFAVVICWWIVYLSSIPFLGISKMGLKMRQM